MTTQRLMPMQPISSLYHDEEHFRQGGHTVSLDILGNERGERYDDYPNDNDDDDDDIMTLYPEYSHNHPQQQEYVGTVGGVHSWGSTVPVRKYYRGTCVIRTCALVLLLTLAIVTGVLVHDKRHPSSASAAATPSNSLTSEVDTPTTAPTSFVQSAIAPYAIYGGSEFDNPASYQSRALQWLETTFAADASLHNDGTEAPMSMTTDRLVQRYALACIYYATNAVPTPWTDLAMRKGKGLTTVTNNNNSSSDNDPLFPWLDQTGWLDNPDECTWKGLVCDDVGRVIEINLGSNRLTGSMPSETQLLTHVKRLDLYNNLVYNVGDAGTQWLGTLTLLQHLYLGQTSFQYHGIPPVLGTLTNLVELDVSYTLFLGPLDGSVFENLDKLEYLYIGGNSYNTSIPSSITRLPNLLYLYAEYADIIGDLSFMIGMPSILELWVDQNPLLVGTIPTEVGMLSSLASLSITGCGLSGPIPTELGLCTSLQQVWLYQNALTGSIPTELGLLDSLKRFQIEANSVTGSMPEEVCNNKHPFGNLLQLSADCEGTEVYCPADCCTCCGEQCITEGEH
jgi:Leucine-rich repeat (LRR) protein